MDDFSIIIKSIMCIYSCIKAYTYKTDSTFRSHHQLLLYLDEFHSGRKKTNNQISFWQTLFKAV